MSSPLVRLALLTGCLLGVHTPAQAHVPHLELLDFSEERPFRVREPIEKSRAIYSWLKRERGRPCEDVDVYELEVRASQRLFVQVIVPVLPGTEHFRPRFAIVGPGLPDSTTPLPFSVPEGCGVLLSRAAEPGVEREVFYEPFGGKHYYQGPTIEREVQQAGTYRVFCWDPQGLGGDYVAVIGKLEQWGPRDIVRALLVTPLIRMDLELHEERPERPKRRRRRWL